MSVGTIVLLIVGIVLLFGIGQRILDKMRLTDRQAIFIIIAMIVGGFLPDIPLTQRLSVNLGGAVIPLGVSLYLWFSASSGRERVRSLAASVVTGAAVFLLMRYFPDEPEAMPIDPLYAYGIAAGVTACIFGRSRRGAFIAGTLGMTGADLAQSLINGANGIDQRTVLGGAGAMDAIVFAGFIAVLLAELFGEIMERAVRGRRAPETEFEDGDMRRKEHAHE